MELTKHEICEIEPSRAQRNVDELRATKERCYNMAMECAKNLKSSFSKVGACCSEHKFTRGYPDGLFHWISQSRIFRKAPKTEG